MLIPVTDFNLEATLESGQVFGFRKLTDGTFEGFLNEDLVQVSLIQKHLWISAPDLKISETGTRKF
jgi:hypothetical protein